jgi:flagellar basal-body rod protein FlgF
MQVVDKLRLVNAEGAELTKNEAGLIVARDGASLAAAPTSACAARPRRQQRVGGREMVATMSLNRSFEIQMRLFKASDKMNEAGNRLLGA